MKKLIIYTLAFLLFSCKKEGGEPVLTGFEAAMLHSSTTDVLLTSTDRKSLALQLVWDESNLTSAQPIAPSTLQHTVEFAAEATFAVIAKKSEQVAPSLSYTHEQLNSLVTAMGFEPGKKKTLYARVSTRLARNVDVVYSNVIAIAVTAYEPIVDAHYLYMANKELTQFPWKICSRKEDGFYDGFVQVDQWFNFYLTNEETANASVIYGSYPLEGSQYILYSGDDRWNSWTSNGGYLYLNADVNKLSWKETVVESLSVTGDFNGWSASATPMTYDKTEKLWKATITNTVAEQWGIKVLINGSWTWFFGAAEEAGTCHLYTADASGFVYDKIGTHTLVLDLSDPKAFKYWVQ